MVTTVFGKKAEKYGTLAKEQELKRFCVGLGVLNPEREIRAYFLASTCAPSCRKKAAKSKKRVCIHKAHIYDRCKNVKGGFLFKCLDGSKWGTGELLNPRFGPRHVTKSASGIWAPTIIDVAFCEQEVESSDSSSDSDSD